MQYLKEKSIEQSNSIHTFFNNIALYAMNKSNYNDALSTKQFNWNVSISSSNSRMVGHLISIIVNIFHHIIIFFVSILRT